jgi:hypothetical protein
MRFPPVAKCLNPGVERRRRMARMIEATNQKMPAEERPQTLV